MHAVHGNEISSVDAALLEAYHLLAAQDDAQVTRILRETLVLIDPLENPDGRARFVASNLQAMGPFPDPEPFAAEHNEPWPGGRANHYLFDMNRDWFAQSQAETRGRTKFFLQWFPQVVVDLHEMGGDSTYYFAPPADPLNPHITPQQIGWFNTIRQGQRREVRRARFRLLQSRGLRLVLPRVRRVVAAVPRVDRHDVRDGVVARARVAASDDDLLTYRDGVLRHFTSAITTLDTSAANRQQLLRDFVNYRRSAIADGEKGKTRAWLVPVAPTRPARTASRSCCATRASTCCSRPTPSRRHADRGGGHLRRPCRAAGWTTAAEPARSHVRPAGGVRQGAGSTPQEAAADQMYDVTGWNLPSAYDVEVMAFDRPVTAKLRTQAMRLPRRPRCPRPRSAT